jgi:pimeloyl-ACP methyl ester carboxylesterase
MAAAHVEEMVYATTEDGLLLEGVAMSPSGAPQRPIGFIWIHGNAASFSAPAYVRIGRELAARGHLAIVGNTRGHDIACTLWTASEALPIGGGAGWEKLEEAPRDLAAWAQVAADQGVQRIVLVGHSSGAQRVVLFQAERQDGRVAGLALASPDLRGFLPAGELEAARRLVEEGRPQEVTPAQPWAPWYRQSAGTVVGKAEILSHLLEVQEGEPTIASIRTPILAFFGSREMRVEATLETIQRQARSAARVDSEMLADADHFYSRHEVDVAELLTRWAETLA